MKVVENTEGEVERVIVNDLTLDHLAITRAPANPDAIGLASIRSAILDGVSQFSSTEKVMQAIKNVPKESLRHIAEVIDEGDFITVKFDKSANFGGVFENAEHYEEEMMFEEEEKMLPHNENEKGMHGDEKAHHEEEMSKVEENSSETAQDIDNKNVAIDEKTLDDNNKVELNVDSVSDDVEQNIDTQEMEYTMKDEDFAKIADLMRSALEPLNERVKQLEENKTPDQPATVEVEKQVVETRSVTAAVNNEANAELEKLKNELKQTRAVLDVVMSEPIRKGRHQSTQIRAGFGAKGAYSSLVQLSRQAGNTALPTIVEENTTILAESKAADLSAHELTDLLSKGLRAAEIDGLLGTSTTTNWN